MGRMQDVTRAQMPAEGPTEAGAGEPRVSADPAEGALIERSRNGDPEAFDRLVAAHQDRIYHAAYRITGNAEDAYDAAQETFIKAFRALPRYRHEAAFATWLHRIAVNTALDVVRRRPQTPPASLDDVALPAAAHDPDVEVERREVQRRVHQALQRLSPDHRVVVVLRDLQGMAYEEIAAVLRIPVGTVRSRLSRARDDLRGLLRDLAPSGLMEEGS